jgi:hypothetical protein
MRRYGESKLELSANASKVFGAISAGVLVASLSHPVDTIKTCQQVCVCVCLCVFWFFN